MTGERVVEWWLQNVSRAEPPCLQPLHRDYSARSDDRQSHVISTCLSHWFLWCIIRKNFLKFTRHSHEVKNTTSRVCIIFTFVYYYNTCSKDPRG